MKRVLILCATVLVLTSTVVFGQAAPATERDQPGARERAKDAATDTDATYGRIKELTPGQKVVIAIDNSPDKTFDLTDKDLRVNMAKSLKVGDMVKVSERDVAGKTKSVIITKHAGGTDRDAGSRKP